MRGLKFTSILLGVAVDKLCAILAIGILLWRLDVASPLFQNTALLVGSLCTVLGAFVGARHAGVRPLGHGLAIGSIGLLISVSRFLASIYLATADAPRAHSIAWELTSWFLVVAAGCLGGRFAERSLESSTSA